MSSQPLPQSIETEQSVLAACFVGHADEIRDQLTTADFYRTGHQLIFDAICKSDPVDLITVVNALRDSGGLEKAGGASYISELLNDTTPSIGIEAHCRILREKSILRSLIEKSHKIIQSCHGQDGVEQVLDTAQKSITEIDYTSQDVTTDYRQLSMDAGERWEKLYHSKGKLTGVPSGFPDLDWLTSGFQPSDLIIIAARPSMGKTAIALNAANYIGSRHMPVAFFSLEMSKDQLFDRTISGMTGINLQKFRNGQFSSEDWEKINEAQGRAYTWPVYIDDSSALHYMEIRRRLRRLQKKHGVQMCIVDHLQLCRGDKSPSRDREIGSITAGLKAVAKDLKMPVVLLSQLNRNVENRPGKRPMLADLRDSGNIEQDADVIMFLFREAYYLEKDGKDFDEHGRKTPEYEAVERLADLTIAKQRNGPTGAVRLIWDKRISRFFNQSRET